MTCFLSLPKEKRRRFRSQGAVMQIFSVYLWHDLKTLIKCDEVSDKLAQTKGLSGAFKLHRFATHFERYWRHNRSPLFPQRLQLWPRQNAILLWLRVGREMPCIIFSASRRMRRGNKRRKTQTQHFCASFVRLTIINKSFVVLCLSCVLNDPDFIFGSLSMFVHLLKSGNLNTKGEKVPKVDASSIERRD